MRGEIDKLQYRICAQNSSNCRLVKTIDTICIIVGDSDTYFFKTWQINHGKAVEMRCYRRLLHISYKDHITNEIVCKKIQAAIGPYEDILTTVKKRKLRWFGHVIRSSGLCKKVVQGTVPGKRKRGRQKKRWEDNIREWTGLDFNSSQRAAEDRQRWQKIVADVSSGAPTTLMVPGHR